MSRASQASYLCNAYWEKRHLKHCGALIVSCTLVSLRYDGVMTILPLGLPS